MLLKFFFFAEGNAANPGLLNASVPGIARNQLAHRLTLSQVETYSNRTPFPLYSDFSSSSLAIFFFMLMEMAMNMVTIPAWELTEQLAAIKGHHLRVSVCARRKPTQQPAVSRV